MNELISKNLTLTHRSDLILTLNKHANNQTSIDGGIATNTKVTGEVGSYRMASISCSDAINRFGMATSLFISSMLGNTSSISIPYSLPENMISTPKLIRKYPYASGFKFLLNIVNNSAEFRIRLDSGRLLYFSNTTGISPEEEAKLSLHELGEWFSKINKQIIFLQLIGIPSPLPQEVKVEGVTEAGSAVKVGVGEVGIENLDSVPITITSSKTTSTSQITSTITLVKTLVETSTITTTKTSLVTTTQTKVTTKTLTQRTVLTSTTTMTLEKAKPIMSTPEGIGLIATLIVLAVLLSVVYARKR